MIRVCSSSRRGWVPALLFLVVLLGAPRTARAWIENHVTAAEVRIEVDRMGKAEIEQRITLTTNGNQRLHSFRIVDVDRDATPLPNSYAVPARDALSSSLDSAVPLEVELAYPKKRRSSDETPPAELQLRVSDRKGLRRGSYLFVFRYRTDLRVRGFVERDGSMVRLSWQGPRFDDGFDNARVLFVLPASPTAPQAVDPVVLDEENDGRQSPSFLHEVRRRSEHDEFELMRTYLAEGEQVLWQVRVDPRAIEPPRAPEQASGELASFDDPLQGTSPKRRNVWLAAGVGLLLFYLVLVWLKSREVTKLATRAAARMDPLVPLPSLLRALLSASALTLGVALQLLLGKPVWGAVCVVLAAALAAYGAARPDPKAAMRGPGRWLSVTESEALAAVPRLRGAWLDVSTLAGKALLLLLLGAVAAGAVLLWPRSHGRALLAAFDSVALLALFGTGRMTSLPPDMAVEPVRFFRKLVKRLRKMKGAAELRVVPRIRIPQGGVDPDELRLVIVPRLPQRGFGSIEIGLTYALGTGARVAMPEVLLRVTAESPCDEAVAAISSHGRITPGRKPDERVISFAPRLPTVRMTAEITAALAFRVMDRSAPRPARKREAALADAA